MPMKSQAQRAFLHINKPDIAEEFEKETPKGAKLPYKVNMSTSGETRQEGFAKVGHPHQLRKDRFEKDQEDHARMMSDINSKGKR